MTPTPRVVLIVVSILTTFMIMRKIRQSKLQIEDSIFWLGFSSILLVFSIFPGLPDLLAELAGTYTTANFIYLAVIFLLIVKMFHMSIKQSQLETKIKDLAQKIALDVCQGRSARTSLPETVSTGQAGACSARYRI